MALGPLSTPFFSASQPSGLTQASGPPSYSSTITVGQNVANESSTFWGVSLDGTKDPATSAVASALNATPLKTLRYGADWADETNWSAPCFYNDNSICSSITNDVLDFATLCQWLPADRCYLAVPAEIDNIAILTYEVNWFHTKTHWWPACWAIGNEPQGWTHFQRPWSTWSSSDNYPATAAEYARVVQNYTKTLRSIDPNACIVGIESEQPSRTVNLGQWVYNVTTLQPNVTEVAFHDYPSLHCTQPGSPDLSNVNLTSYVFSS
jgi:hypothetical protein